MKYSILSLALSATTISAHFNLDYPTARGFDEDKLGEFPCGGMNTVSKTRTPFPMTGGKIALTMGHIDANVQVLIGMGNNPGSAFNTVIRPTFSETGLGSFCIEGVNIPASVGAKDGMNATIQVITNGDPDGGLYNCADITFSSTATVPTCKNNTGVTVGTASSSMSPNVSSKAGSSSSSSSSSGNGKSAASTLQLGAGMGLTGLLMMIGLFAL